MTKEEIEQLLNGPEWVLPLMQDIAAGKVTQEQIDELFGYVRFKKLQTVLDELCIREAEKGNLDNFLDMIIEKAESLL